MAERQSTARSSSTAAAITECDAAAQPRRPGHLPLEALWAKQAREADGVEAQEDYAQQLGRKRWFVDRVERGELAYTVRDVRRFGRAGTMLVLRSVAAEVGAAVHPLPAIAHADHQLRLAALTAELCGLMTTYTAALADNHVSAAERAELLRRARAVTGTMLELEAVCVAEGRA